MLLILWLRSYKKSKLSGEPHFLCQNLKFGDNRCVLKYWLRWSTMTYFLFRLLEHVTRRSRSCDRQQTPDLSKSFLWSSTDLSVPAFWRRWANTKMLMSTIDYSLCLWVNKSTQDEFAFWLLVKLVDFVAKIKNDVEVVFSGGRHFWGSAKAYFACQLRCLIANTLIRPLSIFATIYAYQNRVRL